MAAPAHTSAPTGATLAAAGGIQLPRGFKSILVFNRLPLAFFFTMKVKPGKLDGGEPIKQSTMLNDYVQTYAPASLVDEGSSIVTAAYDPYLRQQIRTTLLNQPGSATEWWSDGSYEDYFGYLQNAEFGDLDENSLPIVTLTVFKTNYDPVNHVEVRPVFVSATGT